MSLQEAITPECFTDLICHSFWVPFHSILLCVQPCMWYRLFFKPEVIIVRLMSTSRNEQRPRSFSSGILVKLQIEQNPRPGTEILQASSFSLPKFQRVAQFSTWISSLYGYQFCKCKPDHRWVRHSSSIPWEGIGPGRFQLL